MALSGDIRSAVRWYAAALIAGATLYWPLCTADALATTLSPGQPLLRSQAELGSWGISDRGSFIFDARDGSPRQGVELVKGDFRSLGPVQGAAVLPWAMDGVTGYLVDGLHYQTLFLPEINIRGLLDGQAIVWLSSSCGNITGHHYTNVASSTVNISTAPTASCWASFAINNGAMPVNGSDTEPSPAQTGGLSDITAVPGPIAGAGLIPLAGLGAAWFARRRKQRAA